MYAVCIALICINAISYEIPVCPLLFLLITGALEVIAFAKTYKVWGIETTLLMLLCINWPISWRNVLGSKTEDLQLPWFYIVGSMLGIALIIKVFFSPQWKKKIFSLPMLWFGGVILVLIVLFSKTENKIESLKDILPIIYYWGLLTLAAIESESITRNYVDAVWAVFLFSNITLSVMIIFQFATYNLFNLSLFVINISGSWTGETQTGFWFLMEDGTGAPIIMGAAVIIAALWANENKNEKKIYSIIAFIIATGLSLTARRSGIVACMASLVVYGFVETLRKTNLKKLFYNHFFNAVLCCWMACVLNFVRPMFSFRDIIANNERFQGYEKAAQLIEQAEVNPLIGTGMNDAALAEKMTGGVLPHNFLIRWVLLGGAIFAFFGILLLFYVAFKSLQKKLYVEQLMYFNCILGACVIPDIFATRFFAVICLMILLSQDNWKIGQAITMSANGVHINK